MQEIVEDLVKIVEEICNCQLKHGSSTEDTIRIAVDMLKEYKTKNIRG